MINNAKIKANRYGAIDGLRTIACFSIMIMHIKANNNYAITGFFYKTMISSFSNFVFLFMTISAFGMCCGYYEKFLGKNADGTPQICITDFYKKRFMKVLPFFAFLCLLDVLVSPSIASLYEAFADITLLFGFMDKTINVIGVGWFLGLIFVFYLIFPFFCVLIENKRRAWMSFVVSIIYLFVCATYFNVGRSNILYSGCFFILGGLIYLYKDNLSRLSDEKPWSRWVMLVIVFLVIVFYYTVNVQPIGYLLVSSSLLLYAVMVSKSGNVRYSKLVDYSSLLENGFTHFISGISMEIYLSHMVIFRAIEKLRLNTVFGNGWMQYIITVLIVLIGVVAFSMVLQKLIRIVEVKVIDLTKRPEA